MKKYLTIFFFFLILNHAQSQFSSGTSTWTSGNYFSLGSGTNASGSGAIAFGLSTSAYQGAVGLGYANYAYYTGAVAIGYDNYSYGYGATSLGYDNAAQSNYTTAIGYSNYVSSANGGVAIGYDNDTRARESFNMFGKLTISAIIIIYYPKHVHVDPFGLMFSQNQSHVLWVSLQIRLNMANCSKWEGTKLFTVAFQRNQRTVACPLPVSPARSPQTKRHRKFVLH